MIYNIFKPAWEIFAELINAQNPLVITVISVFVISSVIVLLSNLFWRFYY